MPAATSISTRPVAWLAILLAGAATLDAWNDARRNPGLDFYQFWVIGQVLGEPAADDVYSAAAERRIGGEFGLRARSLPTTSRQRQVAEVRRELQTYSTPFLYSVFRWISTGDYERDLLLYQAGCLLLTTASIVLLCRLLATSATITALLVAMIVGWLEPLQSDLRVGNVNQLQLGGLALFLWISGRERWQSRDLASGLVLGLAAAFKPNVAMIAVIAVLWALLQREWRRARQLMIGLAIAAATAVLLSGLTFGTLSCWPDWFEKIADMASRSDMIPVAQGNHSLVAVIAELTGRRTGLPLMIVMTAAALIPAFWRRSEVSEPVRDGYLAVGVGTAIMLLAARLAWLHYFLLLMPGVVYFVHSASGGGKGQSGIGPGWMLGGIAPLVLVSTPLLYWLLSWHEDYLLAAAAIVAAASQFAASIWEKCVGGIEGLKD